MDTGVEHKVDWVTRLGDMARLPGSMLDLIVASLFINILSLALPITLLQVYDRILPNTGLSTLMLMVLGVLVALLLEMVLKLARSHISGWIGARFDHLAGCSAVDRLLSSNVADYEQDGSGVHLERLGALGQLKEFYAGQAILTLLDLPFAVLYLAVMAFLAGVLVFVPIVLILAFVTIAFLISRKLKQSLSERITADDRRFDFLIEVLEGIHTIKSMAMEAQMVRRYERLQETCANADYEVSLHNASATNLGSVFSQITLFAVAAFGSILVIDGNLTVGGLAACTLLAGRALQPLQKAVGLWSRFQSTQLARERVREIYDFDPDRIPGLPALTDVRGEVEMLDVHFNYGKRHREILKGVNLCVKPGEAVAITGGNASGKSTLLYLMMGALRPTQGEVRIDGHNLREVDLESVVARIAYLPQLGVLFNGTVLENITNFRPEYANEALEVASYLGLDAVVAHMPLGYETPIGDGATDSLPRGIKQRIAIARALITRPQVLLFDEANASMDVAGDNVLRGVLEKLKGRRTLIMVTHRPSMLKLCDRVYHLDDGVLTVKPPPGAGAMPSAVAPPPVAGAPAKIAAPDAPPPAAPNPPAPTPGTARPSGARPSRGAAIAGPPPVQPSGPPPISLGMEPLE